MTRRAQVARGPKPPRPVVLLGVGAGIAAFKAAALASQLVQKGCAVHVLMTPDAAKFVAPLTFAGLTGHAVVHESTAMAGGHAAHIALAEAASCFVVAPATADLIARLAAGQADDAVTLTALCCTAPRIFCPAMNDRMWNHAFTRRNAATLVAAGWQQLGPDTGHLAEGYAAVGRMVEPEAILRAVLKVVARGA